MAANTRALAAMSFTELTSNPSNVGRLTAYAEMLVERLEHAHDYIAQQVAA